MYKQASKMGLRFQTSAGPLTVEQLWQLPLSSLTNAIKAAKKVLVKDNDDDLSFLEDNKTVNAVDQLRFDILKDVYVTKKAEAEALRTAADTKAHNQKILALIAEKKEDSLRNMSAEELEKLIIK